MTDEFIPYARQSISEEDKQRCLEALGASFITRGPLVENFEQAFADYCGAKYAVSFSNGSTALLAAYRAAELSPIDRIISTPNTFVATVAGIQYGADVTFVDIDSSTGSLDVQQVEYTLERPYSRGRPFIVPVHLAGIPVDMRRLEAAIRIPNAVVIEDACHALGSHYPDGSRVGSCTWSQMTTFSFHPAKTITTGEGGMVTTNDKELCHRLRRVRNNGIERMAQYLEQEPTPWYYEVKELTSNYHLTDFQAALGLNQLLRVDQFIEKRRKLVKLYRKLLKNVSNITLLTDAFDKTTAFHLFIVCINFKAFKTSRERVMDALREKGIGTQVHYIPLYRHPYFRRKYGELSSFFPQTENYYSTALSLPLYFDLTEEQVEKVVSTLLHILRKRSE